MYLLRQTVRNQYVVTTYNYQVQNYNFRFGTEAAAPTSFGQNLSYELDQIGVHQFAVRSQVPTLRTLSLNTVSDMSPTDRLIPENILPHSIAEEIYQLRQKMVPNKFTLDAEVSFLDQIHPPGTLENISDSSDIE